MVLIALHMENIVDKIGQLVDVQTDKQAQVAANLSRYWKKENDPGCPKISSQLL